MGAGQPPVGATEGKKEIRGSYLGLFVGAAPHRQDVECF